MIAYGDLVKKLVAELWPFGEPISLVKAHRAFFLEAMIDLQEWVVCLQQNHTDVHNACSAYVACGLTVFEAPYGVVDRVYTIVNGDWCSKVMYDPTNYNRIQCWSDRLLINFKAPANAGLPALQQGFRYPDTTTDSQFGRSRVGMWAIHRQKMWIAPWLQSNEALVVEWDGVKTKWDDSDLLDETYWNPVVMRALKMYVQWSHQRDYGIYDTAPGEERTSRTDYETARAECIYWCEQKIREQEAKTCGTCDGTAIPTNAQLQAEKVPPAPAPTVFAILGDFGNDTNFESDVSALIKSWAPAFIVTTGDNWYGINGDTGSLQLASLDQVVGKYYSDFIFPYIGSYGPGGSATQKFYATWGNHDRDPVGRLDLEHQYFSQPLNYYDFVIGPVHYFVLDSGFNNSQVNQEPDGNTATSIQGQWLRGKLALSTATFKLVFLHHPPFSSTKSAILVPPLAGDGTISFPDLQWPYKAWGADAVFCGHCHNYEELIGPDGMIYVVNGAGGAQGQIANEPAIFADVPLSISIFRYNTDFGAQKCSVDCHTLKMEFFNRAAQLIHTITISK